MTLYEWIDFYNKKIRKTHFSRRMGSSSSMSLKKASARCAFSGIW